MEGEAAEVERAEPAAKKSKDDVAALSAWMVENGWSVLDFERHLVEKRAAQPSRLKSLPLEASQLDVFDLHVPNEVWELLCTVVNRNIVAGRSHCVDSRRRDATIAEMKGWYAIQIAIENTWGNDTKMLEKHLSVVKEKYGAIAGLGGDRFRIITAACVPTADELKRLAELLEDAAKKQLEVVRVLAIDEMVIGYAPRKETQLDAEKEGEPIPTVYVPRKPHPNGLECFLACTYVENPGNAAQVPYVCSIVPHLKANDYTSIGAAEKIVRGWPEALGKPHYFADAAFGNIRLVSETAGTGSEMTASVSANHLGVLWRALSCSLPTGCWRAAVNRSQRLVASVHCGVDGDGHRTYQNVLSTNWTCEVPAPQADQQSQPAPQGEPQALVVRAAAKIIPRYTRDTLKGQKLAELKEICKVHNIRPSGTRKEDVNCWHYGESRDCSQEALLGRGNEQHFAQTLVQRCRPAPHGLQGQLQLGRSDRSGMERGRRAPLLQALECKVSALAHAPCCVQLHGALAAKPRTNLATIPHHTRVANHLLAEKMSTKSITTQSEALKITRNEKTWHWQHRLQLQASLGAIFSTL